MEKKKTVAVLFGGQSSEHEVSCMSAANVIQAIPEEKYETVLIGITKEQTSCQSACKTSCGVANQKCENTGK